MNQLQAKSISKNFFKINKYEMEKISLDIDKLIADLTKMDAGLGKFFEDNISEYIQDPSAIKIN